MEYKELFNRAKAAYGTGAYDDATLEFIFPELAESEDERIRKHIVEILKRLPGCHWYGQKEKDDCLAYLEKQKEQKPRDYRKLYEEVVNSEWFKQNYVGKSLGEEENPKEWSEEDERMSEGFMHKLEVCDLLNNKEIAWAKRRLNSLHPQPKQEWSEEDKELLDSWLDVIDRNDWRMDENFCKASREFINRLKSLHLKS